jgi:hypothetical protein
MKKAELVSLAGELGVDSEGLKSDLEDRISAHLNQNAARYQSDERFQVFFSPSKSRRRQQPPAKPREEPKHSPEAEEDDDNEGDESSEDDDEKESLSERAREARERVQELAEDAFAAFLDYSDTVRAHLSTIRTLTLVQVLLEKLFLLKSLIPFTATVNVFDQFEIQHVPDLTVLADCANFWHPMLLWTLAGAVLPTVIGYYVNFKPHKGKKKGGYIVDPMVFALARVSLIHLALHTRVVSCACVARAAPAIRLAVGDLPYLSAAIAIIVSLYTN